MNFTRGLQRMISCFFCDGNITKDAGNRALWTLDF